MEGITIQGKLCIRPVRVIAGKNGLDVKIQRLGRLIIFLVTGWTLAGLALSGNVVQNTTPLNIEGLASSLAASSGNIILTLVLVFLSLQLYWFASKRKYLVEAIRKAFSQRRTNLAKPKAGLQGYAIGLSMLLVVLLVLRYLGVLPGSQPLQRGGNLTGVTILPPAGSNTPNLETGLAASYHSFVTWSLIILVFATVGIIVLIFLQGLTQLRSPSAGEPRVESAMVEETIGVLREGAMGLKAGNDYGKTILKCYLQLCIIFDTQNEVAHHLLTARELQSIMTKQFPAAIRPISLLTALFEEARYSSHTISPDMKDNAIKALEEIEDSLRNSPEVTAETIF